MHLSFTPTPNGGGVAIQGDRDTLRKIERLLTQTAMNSHACLEYGFCMTLSRYFEELKSPCSVDFITLIAGVSALRHSLGYRLSREDHALICLLEHLTFEAYCQVTGADSDSADALFKTFYGLNDYGSFALFESRRVYFYLLKTKNARVAELPTILLSLLSSSVDASRWQQKFDGLNDDMLLYPANERFQYEL